jgi:hypothetical protein
MSIIKSVKAGARAIKVDKEYLLAHGFVGTSNLKLYYKDDPDRYVYRGKIGVDDCWKYNSCEIDSVFKFNILMKIMEAKTNKEFIKLRKKLEKECNRKREKVTVKNANEEVVFDKTKNVFVKKKTNPFTWRIKN